MPTAIQPRIVEAPGRGLVRHVDPRHVPDNAWTNGRNIRFPTGGSKVRKTDGYQLVDDTFPTQPVVGLWWYVDPTGQNKPSVVRMGTRGAYVDLGSQRQPVTTYTTPRTLDDVVTIDQYMTRLIWADGLEVWTWTGFGAAAASLGEGSPIAKLVEIHKDHVLLGHITKPVVQPWRVAYSVAGLLTPPLTGEPDFTGEGSGYVDFLDDSTGLTALKTLGDHAIVHKPNRLYRMIFVGPPDYYLVESIPADEGSISARGPISVGSYQYYPGHTNFYRLGSFSEPIGDAIWPEIAAAIDWPRAHLTFAYRRDQFDEICWKFPSRFAEQPNLTAVYNWRDATWTMTDHDPGTCAAQVPSDGLPSTAFADDAAPVSPPTTRDVFGQLTGKIQVYTGRNADGRYIHAWVESRHFTEQLIPTKILAVPVFATGAGVIGIHLRAAMDARQPMPPWATAPFGYLNLSSPQYRPWVDVRAYGRLWQVKVESASLDDDWELAAYGTAVIPGSYGR
jgi:hypothetical protein